MGKIWNTDDIKYWERYDITGVLIYCWEEYKMVQPFWKTVWQFLTKLNVLLLDNSAILFLGIYPKESKIYVHMKICTLVFVVLFIIAKTWKQLRCPSIREWINKLWFIQTMG